MFLMIDVWKTTFSKDGHCVACQQTEGVRSKVAYPTNRDLHFMPFLCTFMNDFQSPKWHDPLALLHEGHAFLAFEISINNT